MKKNYFTLNTYILFACIFFACVSSLSAQVKNDFDVRYQDNIRGELTFIANNIVNRNEGWGERPNNPYNTTGSSSSYNDDLNMQYIDIDNDGSTFSSSSAVLSVPDPNCSRIVYAGLYWSAVYKGSDRSDFNQVKFKIPGGIYQDITADEVLFDGYNDSDFGDYGPYACYKDVTSIINTMANPDGEYVVANVRASSGSSITGGISGGWTMIIVYENPTLPGKYITTFDGYAGVKSGESVDVPYNGFVTLPPPFPVYAKMAVATLEGDNRITGDQLSIKANSNATYTTLGNNTNPSNNFFNSNITIEDNLVTTRTPNSTNTLGWDVDLFTINNPNNSVIPNDETGAVLRASSTGDKYDIFFSSFSVEVIEPDMQLAKGVFDTDENDIQGQEVALGQEIQYSLSFDNIGNDDGTNFTIKDILPINVDFIKAELPPAIGGQQITYTHDITTNELIFTIPDIYVEVPRDDYTIKINVRVQEDCDKLRDACSNIIENQAYATYRGVLNDNEISDDPSVSGFDTCNFGIPESTNFLPNLDECNFEREIAICGDSIELIAGANYDTYQWFFQNPDGTYRALTGVIDGAAGQKYTATNYGTYKVEKKITEPCKDYDEFITVVPRSNDLTSPFASVADQVVTCPNDGTLLPKFFLCGTNDDRMLNVSFPDAVALVWQKLDESCSAASTEDDCPSKDNSCTWNDVGTGDQYELSGPGEYRLEVRYQNNCFNRFYFKAYENSVDPTITKEDIICKTKGRIDISGVGTGYEYAIALSSSAFDPSSATWQDTASFDIETAGTYNVYIRQANIDLEDGDREPCLFTFEDVVIAKRNFTVNVSTSNPSCSNTKGSFSVNANDARASYTYVLKDDAGAIVDEEIESDDDHHEFKDLDSGSYTIEVTTEDGCVFAEPYSITPPESLELVAEVSQNVSCREGNILLHSTGGSTPHSYAIWSYVDENGVGGELYTEYDEYGKPIIPADAFQQRNIFDIYFGDQGTYKFIVFDNSGCFTISNEVTIIVEPDVEFTVDDTDETCFGSNDGTITVNLINANGYQVLYSIDGGDFDGTNVFTDLEPGTHTIIVRGRKGSRTCDFPKEIIIDEGVQISAEANLTAELSCDANGNFPTSGTAEITFINATGGSGIFEYSLDGVNWQDSPVFSGLSSGTYTPSYRDKNNADCVQETDEITIDPLTPPTDIDFTTSAPQCPAQTSDVSLSVTGGSGAITYEIIAPASAIQSNGSNNTFEDIPAGNTYTFRVTDEKGCSYDENLTISSITPIGVNGQLISNVSCVDGSDGEIRFTVSGFSVNYSYDVINAAGTSVDSNDSETGSTINVTGQPAGNYTITVTDNTTNCTDTASVEVEEPSSPLSLGTPDITHESCSPTGTNLGAITISASGGWGSFTYELYDGAGNLITSNGTGSFSNLSAGDYIIQVIDANECDIDSTTITIDPAIAPDLNLSANNVCYDATEGLTITASITSGTGSGALSYTLNGGRTNTTGSFDKLDPGTHTITVTDGKNCTDTESITINPELDVTASAEPISSCATSTNVTVTASGGDGNYVYAIINSGNTPGTFSTTNPIAVSTVGVYDIYVRDKNGATGYCEAMYTITITKEDVITISATNTEILCNGGSNASLTITANNGRPPYKYSINGGTYQDSNVFNNLPPDAYIIRVRDNKGCIESLTYILDEPDPLNASAGVSALVGCDPDGAEVRITNPQGGTPPYVYSFDGGATYTSTAVWNLPSGDYTVYVKDAKGCTYGMDVTVDTPPIAPELPFTLTYNCDGTGNVAINPSVSTYDYTYSIGGTLNTPPDSNIFNGIPVGTHTISVTYEDTTPVTYSDLLKENYGVGQTTTSPNISSVYCYEPQVQNLNSDCMPEAANNTNINDGEYAVTSRIVSPFGTWDSPVDHTTGASNGRFLAINVGSVAGQGGIIYQKEVQDVIPNQNIVVELYAYNLMRLGTSGQDPNIEVQLVDKSGNVINNFVSGNIAKHTSTSDWNKIEVSIDPENNTELDIVIRTNNTATGGNDIAIDDIYAYQVPKQCPLTKNVQVTVEEGKAFDAEVIGTTNVSCNADNNSEVTISVTNFGASGYEYSLDDFATILGTSTDATETISVGLEAETYTLSVRDIDNQSATPSLACSKDLPFTITEPDPVVVTAQITSEITCNVATATITATTATGGTPRYTYQLEDTAENPIAGYDFITNGTNRIFSNLPIGDYIVRAKDSKDCDDTSETLSVSAPDSVTFTATPTACVSGVYTPQIEVEITGGNNDYLVSLSDGSGVFYKPNVDDDSHIFYNLDPGTYEVTVKDGYGCSANVKTVIVRDDLDADVDVTHIACVDGKIEVTASGGDGNYEYSFDGGNSYGASNTYAVTSGNEGSYDVAVKDGSGACVYEETVQVNELTPISITVTPTQPKCHDEKGAIQIDIFDGVGPYVIVINDGTSDVIKEKFTGTSTTFYNLSAANYTVTVTDNYGCFDDKTPIITNPDELTADIEPILPASCVSSLPDDYGFEFQNVTSTLGTVEFSADGGVTWQTSSQFTGIGFQSGDIVYPSIRTVDGSGDIICQTDFPRYIIPYPLDDLNITLSAIVVNCNELQVDVQGTQGDPPYEYTYTETPTTFDPATTTWTSPTSGNNVFIDLVPGRTYVFYVRDDSGCVRQSSKNVNDLVTLPMKITYDEEPACSGSTDAEISFTVTDTDGTVENNMRWELFDIDGNLETDSGGVVPFVSPQDIQVTGLAPGEYYIEVTQVDAGGVDSCYGATENILIEELDPISGTPVKIRDITCETPGLIQVSDITGGGEEYIYTLTSTDFDIDGDGIYDPAIDFITTTDNPMEVSIDDILNPTVNSIVVDVNVEDQYKCGQYLGQVTLSITQAPEIDAVITDNCDGNASITVNVDATTGLAPYYYSMDGGATYGLAGENEFTGLTTGTYEIMVLDSNGCTVAANADVEIYEPLAFSELEAREALDCQSGDEDAKIFFEVEGGSSVDASTNILYSISGPAGFTNPVTEVPIPSTATPPNSRLFTGANVPGTYTITLKDAQTGCIISRKVEVPEKLVPEVSGTPITTDVTCYNDTDGTITVTAKDNATGPYTFEIIARNGTPFSMAPTASNGYQATFTGLAGAVGAGITYTIEITANSNNACTSLPIDATIYQPENLTGLTLNVTEFACTTGNAVNLASVTASGVTGGTGDYTYEFIYDNGTPGNINDDKTQKGDEVSFNITNIAGGSVVVNVYDEHGCSISDTETIAPYNRLDKIEAIPTNATCIGGDGSIKVDATLSLGIGSDILIYTLYDAAGNELDTRTANSDTHTFTGLDIGNYQIKVVNDNTGCELNTTAQLTDPNTFEIDLNVTSSVVCFGSATGEIEIELVDPTYTGDVFVYIYNTNGTPNDRTDDGTPIKSDTGTANTIITLDQFDTGVYLAEVVQDNAPYCTQTTIFTIATPSTNLTATASVTAQTCNLNDGVIEITNVSSGWGGYKYYVSTTPNLDPSDITNYSDNPRFDGLPTGIYEIWVIDQKGCSVKLPSEEIARPAPIAGNILISSPNCDGLSGEITVENVTGGSGGLYTFQLIKDGAAFGSPKTGMTTTFTGLGAGSYEVDISDNWDCSITLLSSVTLYDEIALTYTIDNEISCDAFNNNVAGAVTINTEGGSGTFDYSVEYPDGSTSDNGTSTSFTGLDQTGRYIFTVEDSEGCIKAIPLDLEAPVLPEISITKNTDVSCEGADDGTIKATVTAATATNPPYTYTLTDGGTISISNTSGLFTDLPAGEYTVSVTSDLGCFDEDIVEITEPTALDFIAAVTTKFACNPNNTVAVGQITVDVTFGTGTAPYLYSIDGINYQTSNVFDVVDTGNVETYTLYVKDTNGCFDTRPVTINPLPKITAGDVNTVKTITCENPEQVQVVITGGSGSFSVELLPNGPTQNITAQTVDFDLPTVGDYVFQVTDNVTGCFFITAPYKVAPYNLIAATATASTPVSCYGSATGEITIDVTNYTGNFSYEVFNTNGNSAGVTGTGVAPGQVTTAQEIPAGNYYVEITALDTPFCLETTNTVTIKSPTRGLDITVAISEGLSCITSQAQIVAQAIGGWGSYEYAIVANGATPSAAQYSATNIFTGIVAGVYDVYVKDAQNCQVFKTITLTQPVPINATATATSIDVLCEGDKTGSIMVTGVTGGRPDFDATVEYLYILNRLDQSGGVISSSAPQLSNVFNNLGAGDYSVTVTDNHDCDFVALPVSITEPTEVTASLRLTTGNTCTTGAALELIASGGTGTDYEYSTSPNGPWTSFGTNTNDNTTLIDVPGPITVEQSFQFYVRDANLCISQTSNSVTISPIRPLEIIPTVVTDVSCYDEATGYIKVDVTGGLGDYLYTLFDVSGNVVVRPEQSGNTFSDLPAGVYFVEVESGDCIAQERIQIEEGEELTSKEPVIFNPICSDDLGSIELELQGGSGVYQYAISPNLDQFQNKNVFEDLEPGTYTIIAQDSKGCNPFVYKKEIVAPNPVAAKANILEKEFCAGDKTASFEINIEGGTPPYYTALNTQDDDKFVENKTMFDGLDGGETYVVFVKDANGCSTNVIVTLDKSVDISPRAEMSQSCFDNSAVNEVTIMLAQDNLEDVIYTLDGGVDQFENTFSNLTPGKHTVTVSYLGCEKTVDFTVDPIVPLNLSVGESNINEFTILPTGGAAPYEYFIDGVSNGNDSKYVIRESGVYEVKVIDANGCEVVVQIEMEFIDIDVPNVFTPDGDNNNDTWTPKNTLLYPKIVTKIYDRYGRVVAELRVGDEWDGRYNGALLPTGDYWYVIKLNGAEDDREFVGHFTLYR